MTPELRRACIAACEACASACEHCATACLGESQRMERCIRLATDCAQQCRQAAASLARGSEYAPQVSLLCAQICEACSRECARYDYEYCRRCAEACRRCAEECRGVAAARSGEPAPRGAPVLEPAELSKNEFLAMLAHELRNPLAAIRNATDILRHPSADAPMQDGAKATLDAQTRNMIEMVNDLLDLSRIMRGTAQLQTAPAELLAVLGHAVDAVAGELKLRRQELTRSLPTQPVWLQGDTRRLEKAFANLLANASRVTPDRGVIELTVRHERDDPAAGQVTVSVSDNGIGIAPELLPKVFELFTSTELTPQRLGTGLGIGLSLARRVVELHRGTIEAHSKGAGHGSQFIVRLPVRAAEAAAEQVAAHSTSRSRPAARRVLLVDDNKDGVRMMTALLKLQGHVVKAAHDGLAGLKLAREFKPEVVLLDIGMPGLDGYAVAQGLRADPLTREALLVAVTGYGGEDDLRQASAAGFDHHLTKPVDADQLLRLVAGESGRPKTARAR